MVETYFAESLFDNNFNLLKLKWRTLISTDFLQYLYCDLSIILIRYQNVNFV
jgi:hypothetical protein